ncbi:S9 family peptidase [Flavobacterium sp. '19STA2R22 D10 B1']|uniref:S9 family peptidase n=1 Tax=Flavobacterium aerium TaxID=3037261 RepID=UPI00278BB274|nr:DPP IV N-terminal domain-containing protein [Flavobacterium sp. '19STA2R22 D10 B1']
MKKISILFLFIGVMAFAQKKLTIEEATLGQYRAYAPQNLVANQWRKDTKTITYLDNTYSKLLSRSQENNWSENTLVTKDELQKALKSKFPSDDFNLRMFPYTYEWKNKNTLALNVGGKNGNYFVQFDVEKKEITNAFQLTQSAAQQAIAPNDAYISWLDKNNINITTSQGQTISVTHDDNIGIVNGSDYTHRQEFGIKKGMWWSPKSDKLLYYRKDETMVKDYPLIDFGTRIAEVNNIKYPMAGMKSEEVTLVVFDVASKQYVTLKTGEPKEQFLTSVTWDPSGNYVYVGVLNREQNHLKMNQYDAKSGNLVKTLFEEKAATYVEPQNDLTFLPTKSDEFLYRTEKDGYQQLYLYNTQGKMVKKLGYNDVVVKELLDFDTDTKNVFYIGTANNGLDRLVYKVELKSGKTTIVTPASGTHHAQLNSDKTLLLDQFSSTTVANEISIVNLKSNKSNSILKADNPYAGKIDLPKMEFVTITSADGKTPLNGRLLYPSNFDPSKKYPVMVYVYGGPHAQLVTNDWLGGARLFDNYMAQEGYVVFTLDNRGSDSRGRDFEHVNHRQLGQNEMADQMKGVEFLKSKSFVNADKIGVYGWSFGGFMSISLMLNQSDTFKVGVAGGPVCDWKYYEVMYGERYMDTPEENPKGYELANVINKANQLKGDLLVIHGAQDPVVVQQNSMEFINACITNGKQVDYFLYPTHEHNVSGKDRVHLNQKIANYFNLHLK